MKLKRVLSLLLVTAMMLSVLPRGIISARAETPAADVYKNGYNWAFDKAVTLGATKGLVSGNAADTIKVMNHEGNGNALTPDRAIANGVLTTTVVTDWGNTVCHGVFYKLPADLAANKTYQLNLNLYGGNDAAAMNGITVSFGAYTDIHTGAGGTIQKWNVSQVESMHTSAKVSHSISGNLPTAADNTVVVEIPVTDTIAAQAKAGNWMLVTFPLAKNGSYKLGAATLKEAVVTAGELSWSFDKAVTFGNTKGLVSGNAADTIKVMNHEGNGNALTPDRAIANGVLTTTVVTDWGNTVCHGVFYKLPADLAANKTYQLNLNLYGGNDAAAMNGITVSFGAYTDIHTGAGGTIQKWNVSQVESMHTSAKVSHSISGNLPTAADNTVVVEIPVTDTIAAQAKVGNWMLVTFPLAKNGSYKLGNVSITEAVDDGNLLLNGDFATGETGWNRNEYVPASSNLLKIVNGELKYTPATPNGDAKFSQALMLEPGKYVMSFDSKGQPGTYRPVFYMSKTNVWSPVGGTQHRLVERISHADSWTRVSQTVTITEAGTYHFVLCVAAKDAAINPSAEMFFDNFEVRKGFDVSIANSEGGTATGLAPYTLPNAANGAPFELVLSPESANHRMTVSCKMGGKDVPITVNGDGSVTIRIDKVTGDIEIKADSMKVSYNITTGAGIVNSNSAASVEHGKPYSANITSSDPNKKLYSVSYTMGGVSVAVPVVDGNAALNIEAVTGDVAISAVLVSKNIIAQWIFDVTKKLTGNGDWGDVGQTISVAHNSYYDGNNVENNRPKGTANVTPNLLSITTNLPSTDATWADAATVIGYKLPADLKVGTTYIMSLPIYAGNDHTTLASSRNGSTRSGVELVFTTKRPFNMWNASNYTVTDIYAEGTGVMATVAPSIGKLSTDSSNVFNISFTVTEEIKAYAVTGNYLALIINHQYEDGHYNIGNATLLEVTEPATVTTSIGDSVCDGTTIAQKGSSYIAHIVPKPGYKVVSASYTMGGGAPVALTVVNGAVTVEIPEVTGDIAITAVTEELEPNNLLTNGSFILGNQFWEFDDEHFVIEPTGGSDAMNDPAFIQALGKPGGILTQSFKVEKQTNYELTFRYKGNVPQGLAFWAITSQRSLAWDSVVYKASTESKSDWTTVTVVFNSGNYKNFYLLFRTVEGSEYGLDNIWIKETTEETTIERYRRPTLGTRPSDSPYDEFPYICDEGANLLPDFGFEGNTHYLENGFSKVEADQNAWEGNNSLHYSTTVSGSESGNLLTNGDLANWDPALKTINGWEFNNDSMMGKLEFVEFDSRNAVKLNKCAASEIFNLEMMQKVYLEAGSTYKFSFDFYGVAHYGPNLVIYDETKTKSDVTNAMTTGTEGEWTTLSKSYTPATSGYYYFSVRIHNGNCPQNVQYISNCSVKLTDKGGDIRLDYELKELQANTTYWLTMFVKAPAAGFTYENFVTFGLTDPETGDFILMANPDAEGARPYKVDQQLVPMAYDGKWHLITVPFNTGDATWLNFTIYGKNSEAWFDNIYIFKEEDAKHFVSPITDKDEAVVTDQDPDLLGCEDDKNLFGNHDLSDGIQFWGDNSHRFGVFGNALNVVDSGSSIYGNALHYLPSRNPTNTYYIKWIDVDPNTEYTFSAKYAITQKGEGFVGLINGYRLDSEVSENRLFPTMIAQFGFGPENYLESHDWQTIAVSFNTGERNRIGFVVCDAGGEAYIDELRLFKTSDGTTLQEAADNFPKEIVSTNTDMTVEDGVVTGIPAGTTLKDVLKNFENSGFIRVFDAEGNEITDKNAKIGTGYAIQLMDGPVIKDAVKVIINGDANGDGVVDSLDSAVILSHISGKEPLEGVYLSAADMDGDGKITVSDAALNTKKPAGGKFQISAVGPSAFAAKEEIEIQLVAGSDGLKAISGMLSSTDGLTFVKAESELEGWELSVKRNEDEVCFAFGAVTGDAAKAGEAVITLTYRVGLISTYDEAKLAVTGLLASTGDDLLTASDFEWMRKAPGSGGSGNNGGAMPQDPILVAARNRLKELRLAEVEISPAFDPELKEYTATVPFEVEKVTVTAVAMDEDAVVTIGDTNLEYVGKNTVAIRVVSADGLQRTYKIIITREPPVEEPTEEPTEPDVTKPVEKPKDNGLLLWALGSVIVTAAVIYLIIILQKRKKKKDK